MDYLNHRYIRKRAFYLSHIAKVLKDNTEVTEVKYMCSHGNHLKPVVMVKVNGMF